MISVLFYGLAQTAIVLFAFLWSNARYGNAVAVTITFFVLSFLELFHSFNIRSERDSAFGKGFFGNKIMFLTLFIGIAVNVLLCVVPVLRAAFGITALTAGQWAFVCVCSVAIVPIGEMYKLIVKLVSRPPRPRMRKNTALA